MIGINRYYRSVGKINKKFGIITVLILLICLSIFLICSKGSDNVTLDEVKLKENSIDKKMFAIMLEQNDGLEDYKESNSNIFPGAGYLYNSSKSGCVDNNGKEVKEAELNFINNKASVKTNKTVYCYLYFSKDSALPDVTNFWIGTHHGSEYTNVNTGKKVHIEWNNEDVTDYCLTTTNSSDSCEWKPISEISTMTANHTAENTVDLGTENKKYDYDVYLKDKAGNISILDDLSQDEIILDTEPPNITGISKEGDNETSIKVNVSVNDPKGTDGTDGSGIEHIYYQISQNGGSIIEAYRDGGKETTHTFSSNLTAGTEYTVSVYAIDLAGNSSQSEPSSQNFTTKALSKAGDVLKRKIGTGGLKSTPGKGDLDYRYVGKQSQNSSINNYVCFGANNCANAETNAHMYRIIGITNDGRLKIQKNSSIIHMAWYSSSNSDVTWPNSEIYQTTLVNFYNSSDVTKEMKEKIETEHQWNIGDVNDNTGYSNGTDVYNSESAGNKHPGEIGLVYLSDYYFAYDETGNTDCSINPYCKSWMMPTDHQVYGVDKDMNGQ